jgi:hypothetical protein
MSEEVAWAAEVVLCRLKKNVSVTFFFLGMLLTKPMRYATDYSYRGLEEGEGVSERERGTVKVSKRRQKSSRLLFSLLALLVLEYKY